MGMISNGGKKPGNPPGILINAVDTMVLSCELPIRTLQWEYQCNDCQATFETTVPKGPKEESLIRCPACDSAKLKRINIVKLAEAKCGG